MYPSPNSAARDSASDRGGITRGSGSSSSAGMYPVFKGRKTGDPVLDGLLEVFPQVNFSTLRGVSMEFKDDVDAAADYVIHNVLPNIIPDDNDVNTNECLYIHGHLQAFDGTNFHLGVDPVDSNTDSNSVQFDMANKYMAENEDSLMGEQLMQSPAVASTSGQAYLPEESHSDSLLASAQNSLVDDEVAHLGNQKKVMHCSDHLIGGYGDEQLHCSSSEKKPGMSASEDDLPLHGDGSPDMTIQSSYSACLESLDNAIADENYKKITLLSNVAAISEMLEEVELNEAKTKLVVSEASQAGNDILVKVEKLKEMSALAMEENNKVAGEVFAEKSILASEALGLQAQLSNISEKRNYFVLIIDEMHHTLQRRLAAAQAERAAAEKEKIERETLAQKSLEEEELLLDVAKEESKRLEQQAQENAKLKELLMDRGHVVDALHGEMLGIFDNIAQLQQGVDMRLPVDEPLQLASLSLSSSVKSAASKSSWSSASQSNARLNDDEKIADASHGNFALDDSWDVVEAETIAS